MPLPYALSREPHSTLLVFRVRVEGFDGQLLMVTGGADMAERSGVMASQIYAMEPA